MKKGLELIGRAKWQAEIAWENGGLEGSAGLGNRKQEARGS